MYKRFLGLTNNPFGMTPDPRFYYRSASHQEAFAALMYGVRERRGFMTLVGEVGTGKTILINSLIETIDRLTCSVLLTHTTVDRDELLRMILFKLYEAHGPRLAASLEEDNESFTTPRLADLPRVELLNQLNAFWHFDIRQMESCIQFQ